MSRIPWVMPIVGEGLESKIMSSVYRTRQQQSCLGLGSPGILHIPQMQVWTSASLGDRSQKREQVIRIVMLLVEKASITFEQQHCRVKHNLIQKPIYLQYYQIFYLIWMKKVGMQEVKKYLLGGSSMLVQIHSFYWTVRIKCIISGVFSIHIVHRNDVIILIRCLIKTAGEDLVFFFSGTLIVLLS